jgi:hypothetical protein
MQEAGVMCRILSVVALLAIGTSAASAQTLVTNSLDPIVRPWQYEFIGGGCGPNTCNDLGPSITDSRVLINHVSCLLKVFRQHDAPFNFTTSRLVGSTLNGQAPTTELIPHFLGNDPLTYQFSESTNYVF